MKFQRNHKGYGVLSSGRLSLISQRGGHYYVSLDNSDVVLYLGIGEEAIPSTQEAVEFCQNEEPVIASHLKAWLKAEYVAYAEALSESPGLLESWKEARKKKFKKS